MKRFLIAIIMSISVSNTPIKAEMFAPKTAKLSNGLEIILISNHIAPVVSISLVYKIGTADDPVTMVGLSHFLEHLMFKGTKTHPPGEFKKTIISRGGKINAYTTHDITAYTSDIPVEILDMVLGLEADRMANLVFDEKETLAEQKVVMEERRMRMDNNPLGPAYESVLRGLFKYHPYAIPPIGYPQHISAYTNDAAKNHYLTWYVPNNAVLIVSGDITMDNLLPMVEKHFGKIPAKPVPDRVRTQDPQQNGIENHLVIKSPRISFVELSWYFKVPNFRSPEKEFFYPLALLSHILGGNAISRLYTDLVDDKQLAIDVSCNYSGDSIDPRHFVISGTLHPSHSSQELKKAIEKHIQKLVENGITETELKNAKRDLLAGLAFARDGNNTAIDIFTDYAMGVTLEDIEKGPEQIEAVTLEQVNAAAKAYLGKMPVMTTTVVPENYQEPKMKDTKKN